MGSQPLLAIVGLLTSPSPSALDLSQRIRRGRVRETRGGSRLRVGAGAGPRLGGSTYIGSATASVLLAAAVGGGSAAGDGSGEGGAAAAGGGEGGAAAAGGGGSGGTVVRAAGGADCLGDTSG
jgi:hypothetical protein